MKNPFKKSAEKIKNVNVKESLSDKHDRAMEAITFAEAGEHDHARELLKKDETKASEREKILVVGHEEGFSETLVNYALGMAERMNYEIAALNVIPMSKRLVSFLNEKVRDELQTNLKDEAESFKMKALEKNIPFNYTVKFGETDRIIKELNGELTSVSFVLTEPEDISDENANMTIPVFCYTDV